MQEVRTCDFCSADATGVYEPVPESIVADGPRLLLCGDCHDRLASVVNPLLDHVADSEGVATDGSDDFAVDDVVTEAESGRIDERGHGTETAEGDGADVASPPTEERSADESAGGESAPEPESGTGGGGAAADPSSDEAADDVPHRDLDPATTVGSDEERRGTPRGYRQVMRFLESREFPIDREEAEVLASSAYDVDREAVSAAIDHAIKYDRLREVHGELKQ